MSNTNVGRLIGGTTRTDGIQTLSNIHQTKMASAWPLSRYSEGNISPALALDFIDGKYRLGKTAGSFSDAFIGNSPKLTYSTAAGSNSTMVNSAGNIVWAPHNLLDYSEDFSQWTASNTDVDPNVTDVLAPDGTQTVDKVKNTGDTGGKLLYKNGVASGQTTVAVFARAAEFSRLRINELSGNRFSANFNLPDEEATLTNGADGIDARITFVGDGWYLCEIDHSSSTATNSIVGYPASAETTSGNPNYDADDTSGIYIWGAHVYRSDLGGMAQVPGADTGFETYVPTNGNAEYLPRVGHHVYNGSAWVNEGMLIESEPRTNLFQYSDFSSGWDETGVDPIALDATGPDGQANTAVTLNEDSTAGEHKLSEFIAAVPASTYTSSVFVKLKSSDTRTKIRLRNLNFVTNNNHADFDLSAGTVTKGSNADNATIENVGNGWFRCSVTSTSTAQAGAIITVYLLDASGNTSYTGDGTSGVLIYGAQLEQGQVVNGTPVAAPTPSSYMPTNGNQFTRTAQSLTVPAHWYDADNPTYTGSELVTNNDFSLGDNGDWTLTQSNISAGVLNFENSGTFSRATNGDGSLLNAGKVYLLSFDITSVLTAGTIRLRLGSDSSTSITVNASVGSYSSALVANGTSSTVMVETTAANTFTGSIDNISVRQVSAPQFGWPEPEVIGPELVENGDFSLGDNGDWVVQADWSITGGAASKTTGTQNSLYQDLTGVSPDSLYEITFDVSNKSGGGVLVFFTGSAVTTVSGNGLYTFIVKASATNSRLSFQGQVDTTVTIDNISVREINPLSVSIQMDGRMTYADDDVDTANPSFAYWDAGSNNYIHVKNNTYGASITGRLDVTQDNGTGSSKAAVSGNTAFSPGVLVPFNISSRHGSTFVNGAVDGVALTADTTPKALPDLSGTNLQIAYDFMGTIGQFRQFAGDIGDAGLVTATNPSTEPTLSLTFDGTGGSFYNLSWSE